MIYDPLVSQLSTGPFLPLISWIFPYPLMHRDTVPVAGPCRAVPGMLQDVCFAGTMAACPFMCRDFLVPIRADEFFVYPDPGAGAVLHR